MKLLLACTTSMSTNLLVTKIEKAAKAKGVELDVKVKPIHVVEHELENFDVVMLSPQVGYRLKKIQSLSQTPIDVISQRDFGVLNGENILENALRLVA